MTTVADVAEWLEDFAPSRLAESWDNVGLLWGDPGTRIERLMTCLTVTATTAAEAIAGGALMIVSHHPILFRETRRIRSDLAETGHLWSLARAGIAIASPHTAFDNTTGGINEILCRLLGIRDATVLRPFGADRANPGTSARSFKVVVFTPESDREAVMTGAFEAGAGEIGAYRECSFAIPGEGTFFATEATDPTVGEKGRRERVAELRLEFVCPGNRLAATLAAVRERHSYEEPAIDVYPLHDMPSSTSAVALGAGRIGMLERPTTLAEFAREVGRRLPGGSMQFVGPEARTVARVAVSCGAGDDFLRDAARAGADVLVTGEARFHRGLEAEAMGLALITAGHHATERPGVEDLARRIAEAFPNVEVWPSRDEHDPFRAPAGQ